MSNNFRHIDHPLRRGGLSRPERDNAALDPATAPPDGRSLGDLLRFWYDYARQVNHYGTDPGDGDPVVTGDWLDFFRKSVPFQYASIGAFDLERLEKRYTDIYDGIETRRTFAALNPMLDLVLEMAGQIASWREDLEADSTGLVTIIDGLIASSLKEPVTQLLGLANGAGGWGYQPTRAGRALATIYGLAPTASFAVDRSISGFRGSPKNKVLAGRKVLAELYRVFWKALEATVLAARNEARLEESLREPLTDDAPPHLGLVFAFLLLYRDTQAGLNSLGDKHLDFFYRKTLLLREQELMPDLAHLILEPARQLEDSLLIAKGLRFKGGKDDKGTEILFELEEDFVLTKTRIAERKTLFLEPDDVDNADIFAASLADTGDGMGGDFPKEVPPAWPTLGAATATYPDPETQAAAALPVAEMGFVLASPVLFLREGKRILTVTITLGASELNTENFEVVFNGVSAEDEPPFMPEDGLKAHPHAKLLVPYLTTEKEWLAVPNTYSLTIAPDSVNKTVQIVLTITLEAEFPAVVHPPEPGVVPLTIPKEYPALKLAFNPNQIHRRQWYCHLGQLPVTNVVINATVCGVRRLAVQNDLAVLDAAEPFLPFGPTPKKNSSNFYVGSEEVFAKAWTRLDLRLQWLEDAPPAGYYDNYPTAFDKANVNAGITYRDGLEWSDFSAALTAGLFSDNAGHTVIADCGPKEDKEVFIRIDNPGDAPRPCPWPLVLPANISQEASHGVLRLRLGDQDFLHDKYPQAILNVAGANVVIAEDGAPDEPLPVLNPPYTPTLAGVSLDYTASDSLADGELNVGHLHPWTGAYEWVLGADAGANEVELAGPAPLLPHFPGEGQLYLGLADYKPGELVNLYFELDAPTADPRKEKATVNWAYLRDNEWLPLADELQVLEDTTDGLIRSGIVKVAPPSDISREGTTVLSGEYHWLRASVPAHADAIAATLRVSARAVAVRAVIGEKNDHTRLAEALDAGALAKVVTPVTGLKGVEQAYPSFSGKAPEAPDHFNRRVSELLRHKGRAITLNDYERIVLEAFPDVYRVKCLTHTLGVRGAADEDLEMAPGHVTLVVIPDVNRVSAVNPFEPRLPAADLEAIREYLSDKVSPCVRLQVLNPEYEKVRLQLSVRFKPGKSTAFYRAKLQRDLRGLLAPWTGGDATGDISFGGRVYYSTAVHFAESLAYVDYVRDLRIVDPATRSPVTFQAARFARSVLTTVNGPSAAGGEVPAADGPSSANCHLITVLEN